MTGVDQAELKLLTDLIQERFGLTFNGIRLEILESRLRPRLRDLHLSSVRDYYQYLRFHPDRESEFARLPAMVTNNETYFFRETHQFDLLVHHVIPERRAALRGRPLRFLSAGCSSGEEPYSLSIALHNAGLPLAGVTLGDRRLRPQPGADRPGAGGVLRRELAPRLRRGRPAALLHRRAGRLPAQGEVPPRRALLPRQPARARTACWAGRCTMRSSAATC